MDQQQLREHLDQLSDAVEGLHTSEEDKNNLNELIVDIERQLTEPLLESEHHTLVEQVDVMVSSFEQDHPTVAAILNNIMLTLTNIGV